MIHLHYKVIQRDHSSIDIMSRSRRSRTIQERVSPFKQNTDLYYTENEVSAQLRECRICLEGQDKASFQNRLISPCKCTGSVEFIHYVCMKQWLEKSLNNKNTNPVKCELCKEPIIYSVVSEKQCNSCGAVRDKIRTSYKIFIFLLILLSLNCGVTVYLIAIFVHILEISSGDPKFIEIGIISFSIVLLLVITSILLGIMVREFLYSQINRIGEILSYGDRSRKSSTFSLNDTRANVSKAQIVPLAIVELEEPE